ncbi:MAG: GAF domain-containing protein [Candidatus Riflebacteria bacterium]|nr:GAF domain-containing protein [Candidatus Riflebacteria bacterium]
MIFVSAPAFSGELNFVYPENPLLWVIMVILASICVICGSFIIYIIRVLLNDKIVSVSSEIKSDVEKSYLQRIKLDYENKHSEMNSMIKELRTRFSLSFMKVRNLTLTLNPEKLFNSIIEMLKMEMGVTRFIIFLKDDSKDELYPFRWQGYNDNELKNLTLSITYPHILTYAQKKRQMIYSKLASDDPETAGLLGREPDLKTLLAIPLAGVSESYGVIHIAEFDKSRSEIDENDLRFFSSMTSFMGLAISNASVFLQTREELTSARQLSEKQIEEKKKLKEVFSRYTSSELVESLIKNPGLIKLGGINKEASILFSDIVEFTKFTSNLSPEETVSTINEYLSKMTDIVLSHQGEIDKFIGDAVMARFGVLADLPNSALCAVRTALVMLEDLKKLQAKWMQEGRPFFSIRIGIATGTVLAGNIGSEKRQEFTAMGSTVNMASRLEALNKQFGTTILIDEKTNSMVMKEIVTMPREKVSIRGFEGFSKVYEVLGAKPAC